MSPKEKAKELVIEFETILMGQDDLAKDCAFLALNEIIDLLDNALIEWHVLNTDEILAYWRKVKEEINNL